MNLLHRSISERDAVVCERCQSQIWAAPDSLSIRLLARFEATRQLGLGSLQETEGGQECDNNARADLRQVRGEGTHRSRMTCNPGALALVRVIDN